MKFAAAEHRRDAEEAGEDRARREDLQRHDHRPRRLVDVLRLLRGAAEAPAEGHPVEPEHVEGGERRRHRADAPHVLPVAADPVGRPQDLVLREEAGEGRDPRDRDAADEHREVRRGQLRLEAAHVPHVLLARHRVDDRARAEEEERLEEGVGEDVEDPGAEGAHAAGQEHVAELADRRVGQHPLDVVLDEADRGREDRGRRAHDRHRRHRVRGVGVDRGRARDHVDAGGHHRGRVDEGGDRRRALHRVREPDVERDLRALARGADEQEEADRASASPPQAQLDGHLGGGRHHRPEVQRAERHEDEEHPEEEAEVADPVDDERLLAGVARRSACRTRTR